MKPLDKLKNLLCENERVNEDMNRKEFIVSTTWRKERVWWFTINNNLRIIEANTEEEALWIAITDFKKVAWNEEYSFMFEAIIESKQLLQERHLKMYCEDEDLHYYTHINSDIIISNRLWDNITFTLDNTKDLYEQSDSVIERIYNFLIESKQWIK